MPREPWPEFSEVAGWPALDVARFRTRGHLVRPDFVEVHVSAEAREAYLTLVADSVLADGTTVALFFSDEAGAVRGPVYAMQKASGSWRYLVTDERGGLDPALDPSACARCHEGAPADGLFGLPRDLPGPTPGLPGPTPGRPAEN